jgi:phage baseplate assembly protein W
MSETIRGISFPFRIDASGGVAEQSGGDKLRENIIQILMTGNGERVMRRDYGGGLRQLIHDPNNGPLWAIIQHQIAKAISRLEPRVLLQDLSIVSGEPPEYGTVTISVQYIVRRTRQVERLHVPIGLGGL